MRKGILAIGVVLAVIGAVVMTVPLLPDSESFSASTPGPCNEGANCTQAFNVYSASDGVFGGTSAKLSWSSTGTVTFVAVTCTKQITTDVLDSQNASQIDAACGTNHTVADASGTSGSYTFTIPSGGSLAYFAFSSASTLPTVSTTLTTTSPLLGLAGVALGIVLILLGLVLRPKARRAGAGSAAPASAGDRPSPPSG